MLLSLCAMRFFFVVPPVSNPLLLAFDLLARFHLLVGYTWNDQSSEPSLGRTASTAKPLL